MNPSLTSVPAPALAVRRSATACQHCQTKKRRCDRRILGSPCTNCRLDELHCTPGYSKTPAKTKSKTGLVARVEKPRRFGPENSQPLGPPSSPDADANDIRGTHDAHVRRHSDNSATAMMPPQSAQSHAHLPHFINPLPSHLTIEDREYLRHKGIFEIPDSQWRTEILRSYFHFVHPLLPLLDLESFLSPIVGNSSANTISLLLFYAVMCSGAAHVDLHVLQGIGFHTRKAARRAFFGRARLLYDFDCEDDRVSLVQAFLLMTYWFDSSPRSRQKDRKFWIREAVTLAQDSGLDLDLDKCDSRRQRLLKRIWWCCFMRDQFVALMTWTPPQLTSAASTSRHWPLLVLDDFELDGFSTSINRKFEDWPLIRSRQTRMQLASLCIDKAKLCLCISQILHARYASRRHESKSQTITILVPKDATHDVFEVVEHDRHLQQWYQELANPRALDLRDPMAPAYINALDMLALHRAHLKLLFLSAMIALHRPQVHSEHARSMPAVYQELSRTKLRDAAIEVACLATSLKNLEMGTHISSKGMTLFLPIMLVHLQDLHPEADARREGSPKTTLTSRLEKYHRCMLILDSIGGETTVSENILPAELEAAFRTLNILPSVSSSLYESGVPRSIPRLGDEEQLLPASRPRTGKILELSLLGTMTWSEETLLKDLSNSISGDTACAPMAAMPFESRSDLMHIDNDQENNETISRPLNQPMEVSTTSAAQRPPLEWESSSLSSPVPGEWPLSSTLLLDEQQQRGQQRNSQARSSGLAGSSTLPSPVFQTSTEFATSLHNEWARNRLYRELQS